MLTQSDYYNEVANFMATMNPSMVIAFKPSSDNQSRFDFLLDIQERSPLSDVEKTELEHYPPPFIFFAESCKLCIYCVSFEISQ